MNTSASTSLSSPAPESADDAPSLRRLRADRRGGPHKRPEAPTGDADTTQRRFRTGLRLRLAFWGSLVFFAAMAAFLLRQDSPDVPVALTIVGIASGLGMLIAHYFGGARYEVTDTGVRVRHFPFGRHVAFEDIARITHHNYLVYAGRMIDERDFHVAWAADGRRLMLVRQWTDGGLDLMALVAKRAGLDVRAYRSAPPRRFPVSRARRAGR